MKIRIRDAEGCDPQPFLLWDSIWQQQPLGDASPEGGFADFAPAGAAESQNQGGLQAVAGLHSAILMCLFTDLRAPDDLDLGLEHEDRRGWWGDSVDIRAALSERPMGSLLWTLERGILGPETEVLAQDYAAQALQVLIDQDAVATFDIKAEARPIDGFFGLAVKAFGRDGDLVYDEKHDLLWQQTQSAS